MAMMKVGHYILVMSMAFIMSEPSRALTIRYDRGGVVKDYAVNVHEAIKSGRQVRIDGMCASACTLYLAKGVNVCITKRGYFKFHHPFDSRTGKLAKGAAEFMMYNYPKWVKNYINAHGGLSRNWITISNAYARKFMKAC